MIIAVKEYKPADITVIIAAYNEEDLIEGCLRSINEGSYPIENINILVGSDGSDDNTVAICEKLNEKYGNIEVFDLDRMGKNYVLNFLSKQAKTEKLFYIDADCRPDKDAIMQLMKHLEHDEIAMVIPKLEFVVLDKNNNNTGRTGETLYQKFENYIRVRESRIGSTVNPFGIYALKKEAFSPYPDKSVCDDLYRNLHTISIGKKAVYAEQAIVTEVRKKSLTFEKNRRIRLTAGGLSTIMKFTKLLSPLKGYDALFIWSHKLLRYFLPYYLILIFIVTLLLPCGLFKILFFSLQLLLYLSAIIGWLLERSNKKIGLLKFPLFFTGMNIGFLLGSIRFFSGKQNSEWSSEGLKTDND
ncbi:MAG: glycosyltransferase [Candidatus Kapaibacterium sp.]